MTKTELIEEIKNRFSQVPYPGDNDLTIHPLGLDEIFYDAIRGKTWQELDTEMLTYHHDCIGVLTTKGFQYYLPAFLIADIQKEQAIFEYLLYWLSNCQNRAGSPIKNVSGTDWLTMRINILSKEQKDIIIKYFEYKKNDGLLEKEIEDIDKITQYINGKRGQARIKSGQFNIK